MRKCLAPFFLGRKEAGLDINTGFFDVVLPDSLVADRFGAKDGIDRVNGAIRDFVFDAILMREELVVVLSGDCLSAIGCLAGLEKASIFPFLLWVDAHADFHTTETTISGHIGGMPLAMIAGLGDQSHLFAVGLEAVPSKRICHVGGRALELGEKDLLRFSGILCVDRIIDVLETISSTQPVWLHFDADYIAPADAPAMRYPAEGGISVYEVGKDLEALRDKKNVLGISISAWAPHLDEGGRTAATCWKTVSTAFHFS
jgi:arginase